MAVRFNNNNSGWMEEMQILFDKINNGSPFGVIREVFSFSPQLRQFLNNKCHFITLPPLQTTVEIEEHRKNTTFDQNYNSLHYRQSSTQNIKINEIANDLESGKIVGEKIISDALLGVVSCCFMDDKNLKDLKKLLSQDQINLSNVLSGKSRLTIEVPRVALENIKLPDMKEIYVNQWYINIFINTLIFSINEGSYTLTGV
ncbi:hypothetical protein [Helicobacter pylori]|uniref:hypothetical protein n=1 Tax=Helicobacter pylori TaxID=210 RepID=UPI001C56A74F|nr:hypothetical protein [Helicobacter pylori]